MLRSLYKRKREEKRRGEKKSCLSLETFHRPFYFFGLKLSAVFERQHIIIHLSPILEDISKWSLSSKLSACCSSPASNSQPSGWHSNGCHDTREVETFAITALHTLSVIWTESRRQSSTRPALYHTSFSLFARKYSSRNRHFLLRAGRREKTTKRMQPQMHLQKPQKSHEHHTIKTNGQQANRHA